MDRVYDSGVSATPTDLPVAPETGYPIAGDPLTATPATKPGAYWFYMMTESLRRLIVDAGLTPDHEDLDLVTDAIDAKIAASVIGAAASETVAGIAELATEAETLAGTDDERIVTPLKLAAAISANVFGKDQTWQNVGASRTVGVTYTNTLDSAIAVAFKAVTNASVQGYFVIDGVNVLDLSYASGSSISTSGIMVVPAGSTYEIDASSETSWFEMRA